MKTCNNLKLNLKTFTGSGNALPPNPLPAGSIILFNGSGACLLNVPQIISIGATLSAEPGKLLQVNGNLRVE